MDENVPNFMKDVNRNIQELKKKNLQGERIQRVPHSDNYNQIFKSVTKNVLKATREK